MKKRNLFGIFLFSSLFLGVYLNVPLYCVVEFIDSRKIEVLIMGTVITFLISIHFSFLQYKNNKLGEEIKELKKEIETLKNKDKD